MRTLTLLATTYLVLLYSCFPTQQLELTDLSANRVDLPFNIDSIVIVDERGELLPMNWDVPTIGVKSKEWVGNPPLNDLNRANIKRIITQAQDTAGAPASVVFRVEEGVCKLTSDWQSVTEYARFKGKLILTVPSRNYTYESAAEMFYTNPTVNGTENGTLRLYNQALKNVVHMALKQIEESIASE